MTGTSPIDSIDLEELLDQAITELVKAREHTEDCQQRSGDNIKLLESVVLKLNHIKDKRLKDSGIIH